MDGEGEEKKLGDGIRFEEEFFLNMENRRVSFSRRKRQGSREREKHVEEKEKPVTRMASK